MHVGNKIKLLRELNNYTQIFVAKGVKVNIKTYRKIEKTASNPSEYHKFKIEKFYNIKLNKYIKLTHKEIIQKIFKVLELHN